MLEYDAEPWTIDAISLLGALLVDYDFVSESPTVNSFNEFENEVFSIHAERWDDEDDEPNFIFKPTNFEVSWHKSIGRSTSANAPQSAAEAMEMLLDCYDSLGDSVPYDTMRDDEFKWEVIDLDDDI